MGFKDILIHIDSTPASSVRLRLGISLARLFGARVSGIHIIPDPHLPPYFKPSSVAWIAEIYREGAQEAAVLAELHFREVTQDSGVTVAYEALNGDISQLLAERARFADLLLLGQCDTEILPLISAFPLPEKVVVDAGTPMLVVPNKVTVEEIGRQVVVAWDGSREAVRALHDAEPLLQTAQRVSLLTIDADRPGPSANAAEMAAHLARHAVRTEVNEIRSSEKSFTDVLLAYTTEFGADLLVMGAYGHTQLFEFAFGGTTKDILERASIPVMLSH